MAPGLVGMKVTALFFDSEKVKAATSKAERRVLSKYGAMVRRADKQSMKPARQVPLSSLSPEERKQYELKRAPNGRFLPAHLQPVKARKKMRPLQSSRPGQPPRVRKGLLKRMIFFNYDLTSRSVVIGPAKLPGFRDPNVLINLEEGGRMSGGGRMEARPHTLPANKKNLPKLEGLWRNSIR